MDELKNVSVKVESGRENDPIYRAVLKATVIAAIDTFNQDDEAYVLVHYNHPGVVLQTPSHEVETVLVNLSPRCSAWIEYNDYGIQLKTRLYGIDQIAVIPYESIQLIHARNDRSRLVSVWSTVNIPETTPPPTPKKPTFTVIK